MGFFVSKMVKAVLSSLENSDIFDRLLDRFAKKLANEIKLSTHGLLVTGNFANRVFENRDETSDDFDSMSMIAKSAISFDKKVSVKGNKFKEEVVETDKTKNKQVLDILKDL